MESECWDILKKSHIIYIKTFLKKNIWIRNDTNFGLSHGKPSGHGTKARV